MAIETFYFNSRDQTEFYNWLTENASDYFDSIELTSEDGTNNLVSQIKLSIGGVTFIAYKRYYSDNDDHTYTTITTTSGATRELGVPFGSTPRYAYVNRVIKTPSAFGVAFNIKYNYGGRTDGPKPVAHIFAKDNLGGTCFIGHDWGNGWSNGDDKLWMAEYDSPSIQQIGSSGKSGNYNFISTNCISLTNVCVPDHGVCYLPTVYATFFSDLLGTECTIERNNINYSYNGYFAMKE